MGGSLKRMNPEAKKNNQVKFSSLSNFEGNPSLHRTAIKVSKKKKNIISSEILTSNIEGLRGELSSNKVKTPEDKEMILAALNSHFIFANITDEVKEMIIEIMELFNFLPGAIVFQQDMPSKSYYIIKSGTVDILVNNQKISQIKKGEGFGELALLNDNPRVATYKCVGMTSLWVLDREIFKKVIEDITIQTFEQNRFLLEKVSLLSSISSYEKDLITINLQTLKYQINQKIFAEGEFGIEMYIVKEGMVSVTRAGIEIETLTPGCYFGEEGLIGKNVRMNTCIAVKADTKCLCLTRENIGAVLSYEIEEVIQRSFLLEIINKSDTLSVLNNTQKDSILKKLKIKNYKPGDVIINKGTPCSLKIYILILGKIYKSTNSMLFFENGDIIGDNFITSREEIHYQEDFIAGSSVKIGEITKYEIEQAIGGTYENILKENIAINIMRKVNLFNSLDTLQIKYLLSVIKTKKYLNSEVIVQEQTSSHLFFIIKRGKVDVIKGTEVIKTLSKLNFFGETEIVYKKLSDFTYKARGKVTTWTIIQSDFKKITPYVKNHITNEIQLENDLITLSDLKIIKLLGKGLFSKVYLVKSSKNKLYALKSYSRSK